MKQPAEAPPGPTVGANQQAAALEIVRREAVRSGRTARAVLSLVRVSEPPTQPERLLLAAVRLLHSPHVIMPHPCATFDEWLSRYAPQSESRTGSAVDPHLSVRLVWPSV